MTLESILFTSPVLKIKKFQFCVEKGQKKKKKGERERERKQSATPTTPYLQRKHTS